MSSNRLSDSFGGARLPIDDLFKVPSDGADMQSLGRSPNAALAEESIAGSARAEEPIVTAPTTPAIHKRALNKVTIPGFEILEILGQGGMGVVYKARQAKPNRLVAIKMMLPSAMPSKEDVHRLNLEAEAAARLKHPNIVQVYQVGEVDDLPFVAMEYVDGGCLAQRLLGEPIAPRRAAELIETLARAMAVAHETRIVHRDLKPGNILMTKDGVPKITDFGLVKCLDSSTMHTMSGTVVGTASYMPPEQAEGSRNIGPHSDVYALGAILYELLTGQPPFRAENVVDTMLQVLHQEPKAPSSLRQGVPAELEVISLKCLEKNPTSRYQSAEELAKDLRRYLDCEPILARPPSAVERVQKWTRKHPAVAALIAVSVVAFVLFLSLWANFTARLQYKKDLLEAKHQLILEKQSDDERIQGIIRQQNDRTERILHATLSAIADFTDSQRDKKLLESERHQPGLLPYQLACALSQACSLIDDDYDMPADEKARLKKQYVDQACELLRVARALDPKMNVAKSLRDSAELAPLRKHIRYQELASELDRAAP